MPVTIQTNIHTWQCLGIHCCCC